MNFDRTLITRLVEGEEAAFNAIFRQAYPKVYAFAIGILKNDFDAEDVVQNVFVNLWVKREMLSEVVNLDSYLFVMARNAVMNVIIQRNFHYVDLLDIHNYGDSAANAEDQLEAKEMQLYIDMVVSNMPPQRQMVYRLSREQGKSISEIAEIMRLKKKTVENHLNLALREIRKVIKFLILLSGFWV